MISRVCTITQEVGIGESASWPMFADETAPLNANEWGIVSIDTDRRVGETFEDLLPTIARSASHGLAGVTSAPWLLGVDSMDVANTAVNRRKGLWSRWSQETDLPEGKRVEQVISENDSAVRLAGLIEFSLEHLGLALEVTRRLAAVVLVNTSVQDVRAVNLPELCSNLVDRGGKPDPNWGAFIPRAVASGYGVLRAYGLFDDMTLSVDFFAKIDLLRQYEGRLPHH